jgi:hypothetical protein
MRSQFRTQTGTALCIDLGLPLSSGGISDGISERVQQQEEAPSSSAHRLPWLVLLIVVYLVFRMVAEQAQAVRGEVQSHVPRRGVQVSTSGVG